MTDATGNTLSDDEKEILEELMNIAFGSASADLGEIIDIRVALNVPEVHILNIETVPQYLNFEKTGPESDIDILEQNFWGDFTGRSFLVISSDDGDDLICLTNSQANENTKSTLSPEMQHHGILLEIGNIMIGACIGKIAELLETVVTYSPPTMVDKTKGIESVLNDFYAPNMKAIVMKTVFSFDEKAINGFLLTITSPASIDWMKTALNAFMESYE